MGLRAFGVLIVTILVAGSPDHGQFDRQYDAAARW
jgi:hypothetical protein